MKATGFKSPQNAVVPLGSLSLFLGDRSELAWHPQTSADCSSSQHPVRTSVSPEKYTGWKPSNRYVPKHML